MSSRNADGDPWSDSVARFNEAANHSLTASRLATAGMLALGAAATAYLWDSNRRDALLKSFRGVTGPMSQWWNGASNLGQGSTTNKENI